MRVLVCGSRNYLNGSTVNEVLGALGGVTKIIEGGARGADSLGRAWAKSVGCPVTTFPARWSTYGKAAGPIRNKQMLEEGKPDLVVAFLAPNSRGTANMIKQATEAGVEVKIINV